MSYSIGQMPLTSSPSRRPCSSEPWTATSSSVFSRERQEALYKGAVKGRGAKKGKGRGKGAARYVVPSTIPQVEARTFAPEGASVWRGVVRSEWCGHCPPHRRIAASWLTYGEQGALRVVLQRLWDQSLGLRGVDRSACPYDGLWDDAADAEPRDAAADPS